jgi:tetratricopeptide (TPR) repeat protein
VVDIGLGFIPFGNILGPAKTGLTAIAELAGYAKDHIRDSQSLTTEELAQKESKSIQDLVMDALSGLFDMHCPCCILIDDAQFSRTDPTLTTFTQTLLETAWEKKWPLLLIVTHWEKEWHEDWESDKPSIAQVIKQHQQKYNIGWKAQHLKPVKDLSPMLKQAFSGLTETQQKALLQRADGNPRYLDEIIRFCKRSPRLFENRDQQQALTTKGLETCLEKSMKLHDLVEDRLYNAPDAVKQAVSLASLQGETFLTSLTEIMAQSLNFKDTAQGLQQAEKPHCFINGTSEEIAEFTQHIFHEVAEETLEDITDREDAEDLLKQIVSQRLDDTSTCKALPENERVMTYRLGVTLFEQAETEQQRAYAARALAKLVDFEYRRYDYKQAVALAQRFMQGKEAGLWSLKSLSFNEQWRIYDALKIMGKVSQALMLSKEMTELLEAEELDTPDSRRDLSVSYNNVGGMSKLSGDHEGALSAYQKSLSIRKALAEELDTPESRRDLAVSYAMFAQMAEVNENVSSALDYFEKGLQQAKVYQAKQQCPDADQVIDFFENQIQRLRDESA